MSSCVIGEMEGTDWNQIFFYTIKMMFFFPFKWLNNKKSILNGHKMYIHWEAFPEADCVSAIWPAVRFWHSDMHICLRMMEAGKWRNDFKSILHIEAGSKLYLLWHNLPLCSSATGGIITLACVLHPSLKQGGGVSTPGKKIVSAHSEKFRMWCNSSFSVTSLVEKSLSNN